MLQDTKAQAADARTGGRILVDQLRVHGVDTVYCVPGESYLEVLDALHDEASNIALVNARHEAGAANMAEAHGKLTGEPGICMVTRGPGACQAAVGIHTAAQDSTPLILFVGQVARDTAEREAFQEIDYRRMFGSFAKWVGQIEVTERIPEYVARAFRVATSGRPGPVVLSLPEDMLTQTVQAADARPYAATGGGLAGDDLHAIAEILSAAARPMMIVGGGGWSHEACAQITAFAKANNLPVVASFRRQDTIDNGCDIYVGDFGTAAPARIFDRLAQADALLIIGARMGEMTTRGYTSLAVPNPHQRIVHIHADANEIGRVFSPELGIAASPAAAARALAECRLDGAQTWAEWCAAARAEYVADIEPPAYAGELDLAKAFTRLRETLPGDAIVTVDAGNHTGWPQRFLRFARPGRLIGATSGAMGYSVPAAVAAAIRYPKRMVISCVGDGGFMMSGQEIATAVQHGAKPIVFVFNNRMYGTIRMHQERDHPGRISGTDLTNPDFCAMAQAMGAHGEGVKTTADFIPAFERAVASGKAALVELVTDPEQITTRTTLGDLRHAQ